MKTLTIAIPTYNGELTISNSILSIIKCFDFCTNDDVELIISDNASTDNTEVIVKNTIDNNKNYDIKYYRNDANVGFDSNADLCVKRASGKYVWVFSDSEVVINERAVYNVIGVLKQKEYDFLMLNYGEDNHFDNIPNYYNSGDVFFICTNFRSNFITSCVVNKNKWIDLHLENYYGSCWIQTAYQIKALSPKFDCVAGYINDIYISSFKTKPKWGHNGSFILVGIKLLKLYTELEQLGYNKKTIAQACNIVKGGYPFNICLARINGLKMNKSEIRELIDLCKRLYNPLGHINIFFLRCPVAFCYIYYLAYRAIRLIKKIIDKLIH